MSYSYSISSPRSEIPPHTSFPTILAVTPIAYDPSRKNGGLPKTKIETFPQSFLEKSRCS